MSAIIHVFAAASLAANHTSAAELAREQSDEDRTLIFPGSASLGALGLIAHNGHILAFEKQIGTARGTVKLRVPKGTWLSLELNPLALMHPDLLDSCSAVGLDCLIINFMAMDDKENGWCDAALQHANHFKNLKCLILDRSDVSDAGISQLREQQDLEFICCRLAAVRGDCFKTLSQFKKLQVLQLGDDNIKEENLKYLSDCCPNLTAVDLQGSKLGPAGVKYLSRCSNITELRIGCNPTVDEASIKSLLNLKRLSRLVFDSGITLAKLKVLKPMQILSLTVPEGTCTSKDLPILKTFAKKVEFSPRTRSLEGDDRLVAPLH